MTDLLNGWIDNSVTQDMVKLEYRLPRERNVTISIIDLKSDDDLIKITHDLHPPCIL